MARTPDKPGTYRIKRHADGTHTVSGKRLNGTRVKIPGFGTREEADLQARSLFGFGGINKIPPLPTVPPPSGSEPLDSFGLPRITVASLPNFGAAAGKPAPKPETEEEKRKKKMNDQAQSLMELGGVAWAAGSVWLGRKACDRLNKERIQPNPEQTKQLAAVTKETLIEWFGGDKVIKPWQMMVLLTIGIPLSMVLQARPLPKPQTPAAKPEEPNLRVVPDHSRNG